MSIGNDRFFEAKNLRHPRTWNGAEQSIIGQINAPRRCLELSMALPPYLFVRPIQRQMNPKLSMTPPPYLILAGITTKLFKTKYGAAAILIFTLQSAANASKIEYGGVDILNSGRNAREPNAHRPLK